MGSPAWADIETVASQPPLFVSSNETLRQVARMMWEQSVGALLVRSPRGLAGIISERDIATALARGADPDEATAGSAMSADIVSLRPGDTLLDAAVDILDVGIRHIPVIDAYGEVQAMVSVRDLLRPLVVRALGG